MEYWYRQVRLTVLQALLEIQICRRKKIYRSIISNLANLMAPTDDVPKIQTRIGTNGSGAFCGGHSNATGLRLYFDVLIGYLCLAWN